MKKIVAILALVLTTNAHAYRFVGSPASVITKSVKDRLTSILSEDTTCSKNRSPSASAVPLTCSYYLGFTWSASDCYEATKGYYSDYLWTTDRGCYGCK